MIDLDKAAQRVGSGVLVRVDERAATLGGARIAAAGDLPARAYVPNNRVFRRLRNLTERDAPTRTWVRAAVLGVE